MMKKWIGWMKDMDFVHFLIYLKMIMNYNEISYSILLKIRKTYKNAESRNEKRYFLTLTEEEIDYIFELMLDMFLDLDYSEYINFLNNVNPAFTDEHSFKQTLDLTNSILQRIGKPIQNIKNLEKYSMEMKLRNDEKKRD